jgi:hypothetical protein
MFKQIEVLYDVFNKLNELKFNDKLVKPVITIQAQKPKESNVLGWFTTSPIWVGEDKYYEINITAEYLNRPVQQIVATLLHEMVHMSNTLKGIKDCSTRQFHNFKFKREAERVGLVVKEIKGHGYAQTELNRDNKELVESWNIDQSLFDIHRIVYNKTKPMSTRKPKTKLQCPKCNCKVETSEDDIQIICGKCGCEFEESD